MKSIARASAAVMALGAAVVCMAGSLGSSPVQTVQGSQAYEQLGTAVALADVDGDGKDDLIVGCPYYDDGTVTDAGRVLVYLAGNPVPTVLTGVIPVAAPAPLMVTGGGGGGGTINPRAGATFGASMARAGDLDGDGYTDVVIGAP